MQPFLKQLCETKRVPNSLLFCGEKGSGKLQATKDLALFLMGESHRLKLEKEIHPDFRILRPEGKVAMLPMAAVRGIIHESVLPPFEAPVRIFVIDQAHRMLPTSSNALLKTLEEPSAQSYFILLTSEPEHLLQTIVSRSRRIDFAGKQQKKELHPALFEVLTTRDDHKLLLASLEKLEKEVEAIETFQEKKELLDLFFEQILMWYRDVFVLQENGSEELLHYREHVQHLSLCLPPPPWNALLTLVEKCRLGLDRSIKMRAAFEYFFLQLSCL